MEFNVCNFIYWNEDKKYSFDDYNFILPDISIGNIGQLAIDLLLNNLAVEHLGRIVHPCFLPFIGADPFQPESKKLASSCEIYECKEKKIVFLQIRSCVFRSKFSEFRDLILHFIKQFNFKLTIAVASSSSAYFSADQLKDVPLHYLSTSKFPKKGVLNQLKWKEFSLPHNVVTTDLIPESFVSQDLLESCEKEKISLVTLICVCSEGDNCPEARQMVNCINLWLTLKPIKDPEETWKVPVSWDLPYGSAPPRNIY